MTQNLTDIKSFRMDRPINDRVDRASATEAVDSGSIPVRSNQRL